MLYALDKEPQEKFESKAFRCRATRLLTLDRALVSDRDHHRSERMNHGTLARYR